MEPIPRQPSKARLTFSPLNIHAKPVLLAGEIFFLSDLGIENNALFDSNEKIIAEGGRIWITNFRIILRFYETGEFSITYGSMIKMSRIGLHLSYELFCFTCRDLSATIIGLQNAGKFKKDTIKCIQKFSSPGSTKKLFCFSHTVPNSNHVPGWDLLDVQKEFTRQGVNMNHWRKSEANTGYKICGEYPAILVVPNQIKDPEICQVGQARYRGKVPALLWGNQNGALLLRSSQLLCLGDDLTFSGGIGQNKWDIAFIRQILTLSGKELVYIVELGTETAFSPVRGLYTGFYSDRCQIKFLGLPLESILVDNIKSLSNFCISGSLEKVNELEQPEQIRWLGHCHTFLIGVTEILKLIEEGPIILQSYESTTLPAISALAQIVLDPYYRTIEGFCTLIEKDFIYYGHKFFSLGKKKDDENSSVFLLFLDCTWQIMQKYPLAFQYEESLLLYLLDSVYSCQYGSFLASCEKEKADLPKKTASIWSFILTNQEQFTNPLFMEQPKLQNVQFEKSQLRLWGSFYLRNRFRTSLLKVERSIHTAVSKNVYSLELSSLKIPFFHTGDANLRHVTSINLQGNIISQLPLTLINLPNLKSLCLEDNQIPFIPNDFLDLYTQKITTLEELNFKNNQIKEISSYICRFSELRVFNIHGNLLTKFPDLTKFDKLQELDIGANNITSIHPSIFEMINLTVLDISLNPITSLPNEISLLTNLRKLNISSTNIQSIPNQISLLVNLISLDISNNTMKTEGIPDIIFKFNHLEELGLALLNITEIPVAISQFTNLQVLDIVNNKITILPNELLSLSKLRILKLSHNSLTSIPLAISKLDQLIELHLNNNKLQALTPGVGKLEKLRVLNISSNKIKHIPGTIGYLKTLEDSQCFIFDNNLKLKTPPPEIITQGYAQTFDYLRGLLTGEEKIFRMKIMMVGQENVGKTSIVRCLKACRTGKPIPDNAYIEDMEMYKKTGLTSKSTDGISIGNIDFKDKATKQNVELSVWDFGGQEIYYTTHQFFLSDRALYLLVWNIAKKEEDSRVEYWLKSINARAPNAPIIIVATHVDDLICTKDYLNETIKAIENKYFQQFPSIQNVCTVSCKSGFGIVELNLWIQSIVLRQKFMGEIIPKTYAELEKLVKQEKRKIVPPVVSWKQLEAMGVMCNIKSSNTLFTAAQWLHNLGTIINFQKQKGLEDVVILDPQWLTDVMSSIVTFQHTFIRNGVLQHNDLPHIWVPPKFPPRLHKILLNLLEKFEISYYLRSTKSQPIDGTEAIYTGKSLVPSLLPEERPVDIEKIWPHFPSVREEQFSRRYKFGFIPHGFISRLMVRVLHFAEPTICWRYGMLVEKTANTNPNELSAAEQEFDGNFSILVEAQPAQRIVDVIIRGSDGKKLAQLIIESINSLIDGWYSVNVEILIPCIHCVREKNYQPFFFHIEDCEQAAIDGKSFIKCANIRDIRLDEVVPDIAMTHVQNCKLTYSELVVEKEIGQGGFAIVYKGNYQGKVVAIKRIKFGDSAQVSLDDTTELQAFSEFRREVWIMSGLVHSNIVQMAGFTMDPFCIITEFVPCGNLYDIIHDDSFELTWNYKWRCALDIAKGMNYLHTTSWPPIIHRDLKSPNILMSSLDERAEIVAKVADFGLSQALASTTKGRSVANPVWLAPEIIQNQDYTEKADVYSYGVILYELASRENFFGDTNFMSALENRVIEGERPHIPVETPNEFAELIRQCWDGEADKRPPFSHVIMVLQKAIKRYAPQLYDVAILDKEVQIIRPKPPPSNTKKYRSQEEIEKERNEAELFRKARAAEELKEISHLLEPPHQSSVQCLLYVPACEGREEPQIWSGTSDGSIFIWNLKGQQQSTINAHSNQIFSMIYVKANETIWTSSSEGLRIYLARNAKLKKEIKGVSLLCLLVVGKNVWGGSSDSFIYVFDIKGLKQKKKIKVVENGPICSLYHREAALTVWAGTDLPGKNIVLVSSKTSKVAPEEITGHTKKVNAIIDTGNLIWSCSGDRNIIVWNSEGVAIRYLPGHTGPIFSLVSQSGQVWSASWDKTVIIWDAEYQTFYKEFEAHSDAVSSIVFIPETKQMWTGSWDKTIRCWTKLP